MSGENRVKKPGVAGLFHRVIRQVDISLPTTHSCVHPEHRKTNSRGTVQHAGIRRPATPHEVRGIDFPMNPIIFAIR